MFLSFVSYCEELFCCNRNKNECNESEHGSRFMYLASRSSSGFFPQIIARSTEENSIGKIGVTFKELRIVSYIIFPRSLKDDDRGLRERSILAELTTTETKFACKSPVRESRVSTSIKVDGAGVSVENNKQMKKENAATFPTTRRDDVRARERRILGCGCRAR